MKRSLSFVAIAVLCLMNTASFAQSLSLSDTVEYVYGNYDEFELVSHVEVFNETNADIEVKVKRIEGNIVSGMDNAICWEQCYLPSISESPTSLTVKVDSSVENFSGHLYPNQLGGSADIFYVFFNVDDPNDSVVLHVYYQVYGLSVQEEELGFTMYPNPTSSILNVEFTEASDEKPIVYSALGQKVSVVWNEVSFNRLRTDLSNLPSGMYFVKWNGRTERLVVN